MESLLEACTIVALTGITFLTGFYYGRTKTSTTIELSDSKYEGFLLEGDLRVELDPVIFPYAVRDLDRIKSIYTIAQDNTSKALYEVIKQYEKEMRRLEL